MNKKLNYKSIQICYLLLFALACFCKYYQYNFLSTKYFIDSNKILKMIADSSIQRALSYNVTASFFRLINVFGFNTLLQWSIGLTFIFNVIFFAILNKYKSISIFEVIFIFLSLSVLDIFAFNLSKEIIQLLIFLAVYFILTLKIRDSWKVICINFILLLETILFRNYYILMLIIFDISYFVIKKIDFKSNKIFKKLFYIIGIFLIVISISRILVPSLYNDLIDIRTISENNLADANTLIKNVLTNNSSLINYIGNYIINLFRMLIPIELVTKGAIYIIFFFYQLMISYILFNGAKKANKSNLLPFCVVLSYFLASVTFEPDFGSVVRHESTLAIIIFLLERNCVYVEEKGDINGES